MGRKVSVDPMECFDLLELEVLSKSLDCFLEDIHDCGHEMYPSGNEFDFMSEEGDAIEATAKNLLSEVDFELVLRKRNL